MRSLESYVEGKWVRGNGEEAVLVNPATEEPLATTSTKGLDFGRALAFAREKGGVALRALSFGERGALLAAMAKAIHAHRDELLDLAIANGGNTRSDGKFDIDGATGTLAAYGDLGKELGDKALLVDGEGLQLGRGARLWGQHMLVPRTGVAVHVNAYNFPAWGLGEKGAAALLAGMPIVAKPAPSTALVAQRIVQIVAEAKILPEGALTLLSGDAFEVIDHLEAEDVLAFTGSSATGALLRQHPRVSSKFVRVNVEADSVNAAVLGPDVEASSDLFGAFVTDVAKDMTQKAGQKCTAIRRIFVPKGLVDAVVAALRERLEAVKVGDPSKDEVGMGPLSSKKQQAIVKEGLGLLSKEAKVVFGETRALVGVVEGKGFFQTPVLFQAGELRREAAQASVVNRLEVFGPVATVIPYDGEAVDAAALVAAGGGGLVVSVYGDDRAFLSAFVLGVAPFHGRVAVTTSKLLGQAIPPGMVLPQLLHGGPGRAGGGEELGGRRGLGLYMQRVALQGDRAFVETLTGTGTKSS